MKVLIIMQNTWEARRRFRGLLEIQFRMPTLGSLAEALDDEEAVSTATTAPACRTTATRYPEMRQRCEHPRTSLYKAGNQAGRFRECRECGSRWTAEDWINPISGVPVEVWETTDPRTRPGGKIAKEKQKSGGQPKAASSQRSSGYSSSSARPSQAVPKPKARPTTAAVPTAATATSYVDLGASEMSTASEPEDI